MTDKHFAERLKDLGSPDILIDPEFAGTFSTDGVVHARSVFDADEILAVSRAVDLAIGGRNVPSEHLPDGFESWRAVTTVSRELSGLACDARLVRRVITLLGTRIRLLGSQFIRRHPIRGPRKMRTPDRPGWHRDVYGMAADVGDAAPHCAIKCAVWLSDAPHIDNGATRFLPGSHLTAMPIVPHGMIDPPGWTSFSTFKGDVTFFGNRIAHAGGINVSDRPIEVLMIQYGYRWLAPLPPRPHQQAIIDECCEVALQLLEPDDCTPQGEYRPGIGAAALKRWADQHGDL